MRPYKKEEHWQDNLTYEELKERGWASHALTGELLSKEESGTNGKARLVQNLICEGIGCTYKKVKTRVMLAPGDTRKQILPKKVQEYYYYEGKLVKELDYLDE